LKKRAFPSVFTLVIVGAAMILGVQWAQGAIGYARQVVKNGHSEGIQADCHPPADELRKTMDPLTVPAHLDATWAALGNGFGVQYWGDSYSAETLAAAPHGLLIIEAAKVGANHSATGREVFFTPDEVQSISHQGRRPVLAYLNLSEIETYRDYWVQLQATGSDPAHLVDQIWIGPRSASGEHLAQFWTPEWEAILAHRVDMLMELGFDGLFFDDVLHYYSFAAQDALDWTGATPAAPPPDAASYAQAMMGLVERLAGRSRISNCDAIIIVNSGAFIGQDAVHDRTDVAGRAAFHAYLDAIDAIMMEDVFTSAIRQPTIEVLQEDFAAEGAAVLAVDFATSFSGQDPSALRAALSHRAAENGFFAYLADDTTFDRLYPPIVKPGTD
jgi:uncharacterized protein (TIGR01370 family)